MIKKQNIRVSCAGGCGVRISLHYNPSFHCRKCARKNRRAAIKLKGKQERGTHE